MVALLFKRISKRQGRPPLHLKLLLKDVEIVGAQYKISGVIENAQNVTKLTVDKTEQDLSPDGLFVVNGYVPPGGYSVVIYVETDLGLGVERIVNVSRTLLATGKIEFNPLNPLKRKAVINNDALALVIGVSDYKETNAKAIYADSDAKVFQDYAIEKLGVPRNE